MGTDQTNPTFRSLQKRFWKARSSTFSAPNIVWYVCSETGRIRFRGVRFQTPNSVSFSGLTEFWGANSVSSSQPIICVPKRTHRVLRRTHRVCRKTQWVLFSETVLSKQYSARFLFAPVLAVAQQEHVAACSVLEVPMLWLYLHTIHPENYTAKFKSFRECFRYTVATLGFGTMIFLYGQKAADVWKKDVWEFQAFSQTIFELRFSLGNEGKDGKNLNSQTWPGTPRRPSPRHPRPLNMEVHFPSFVCSGIRFRCICSCRFFWIAYLMQLQFCRFPELISHKFSREGYGWHPDIISERYSCIAQRGAASMIFVRMFRHFWRCSCFSQGSFRGAKFENAFTNSVSETSALVSTRKGIFENYHDWVSKYVFVDLGRWISLFLAGSYQEVHQGISQAKSLNVCTTRKPHNCWLAQCKIWERGEWYHLSLLACFCQLSRP